MKKAICDCNNSSKKITIVCDGDITDEYLCDDFLVFKVVDRFYLITLIEDNQIVEELMVDEITGFDNQKISFLT